MFKQRLGSGRLNAQVFVYQHFALTAEPLFGNVSISIFGGPLGSLKGGGEPFPKKPA
jgi:hypothetical protein